MKTIKKTFHKVFILLALTTLRSAAIETNQIAIEWGEVTNNAQISLQLVSATNSFKIGVPSFMFLVKIQNMTTNEYFLGRHEGAGNQEYVNDIFYKIISPSGKDISPKNTSGGLSGVDFMIPPQRTYEFRDNFNALQQNGYLKKMDEVGIYKIVAIQNLKSRETGKRFAVISNPVLVKMMP